MEFTHERVLSDFRAIGILTDKNKPISKSLFANQADIHGYGKLNIWIFRNSRERIYGFYPMQGTRKEQLAECYAWYLELVNGDLTSLDNTDVCFGNCGIPLVYGNLRVS